MLTNMDKLYESVAANGPVCVGLDTRLKDIVSKENRNALWAFLAAQAFNIVVTLVIALVLFGILKPMLG